MLGKNEVILLHLAAEPPAFDTKPLMYAKFLLTSDIESLLFIGVLKRPLDRYKDPTDGFLQKPTGTSENFFLAIGPLE